MSSSVSRVNMEVSASEAFSHLGTCVSAPHILDQRLASISPKNRCGSAFCHTWTGWMHDECFQVLSTTEQQLRCSNSRPLGFIQLYIIYVFDLNILSGDQSLQILENYSK